MNDINYNCRLCSSTSCIVSVREHCARPQWFAHTTELSFFNSFLLQQWKIFLRQSNEEIRLQLLCPSSHNSLLLPLYSSVAGAALMDISEVHKRVHLELEENVSAEWGGRIKVLSLVYTLSRKLPINCWRAVAPAHLHRGAFSENLLLCALCVWHRLPLPAKPIPLLS